LSGSGVRSIIRNASYLMASGGLTYCVRALYIVVLARYLGPELYGVFAYGQAWYMTFLMISLLGLDSILVREIGRDGEAAAGVITQTLSLRVLAIAVVAPLCVAVAWIAEPSAMALHIIMVFSVALAGRGIAIWVNAVFNGGETSRITFRLEASFRLLEVVAGLAAVGLGAGIVTLVALHAVSWWLQALCGLFLVWRRRGPVWQNWSRRGLARLLWQGVPVGIHAMLASWMLQAPLLLFRHVGSTDAALGQLALVIQAVGILAVIPGAIMWAATPVLGRAVARDDRKDKQFTNILLPLSILAGAILGLGGMAAGPWIVNIAFGVKYEPAGALLGIGLWLMTPYACATFINSVLFAHGRTVGPMLCSLAGGVVVTVMIPVLATMAGGSGPLIAAAVGMGVWALGLFGLLTRFALTDVDRLLLRPGFAVAVGLGTYLVLEPVGSWYALAAGILVLIAGNLVLQVFGPVSRMFGIIRTLGRHPRDL